MTSSKTVFVGNFNLTVFAEQIFPEAVQGSKQFSVLAHGILKSQGIIFSIHGTEEDIQWYDTDIYNIRWYGNAWGRDYPAEKDRAELVEAAPPLKDDRSNVNASHSHLPCRPATHTKLASGSSQVTTIFFSAMIVFLYPNFRFLFKCLILNMI